MVSALLVAGSPPALVLDAWRERRFDLIVSDHLVQEVDEVLARPKFERRVTAEQRSAFVVLLRQRGDAQPDSPPSQLLRDPDDDYLAGLALSAHATHLVSGDKDVLAWRTDAVQVRNPRQFLDELQEARRQEETPS
jgi:uncharacterized protein